MWQVCVECKRQYNDESCWTICPHGPLYEPLCDYCPYCDIVVSRYGPCRHMKFRCGCSREEQWQESVCKVHGEPPTAVDWGLQYTDYKPKKPDSVYPEKTLFWAAVNAWCFVVCTIVAVIWLVTFFATYHHIAWFFTSFFGSVAVVAFMSYWNGMKRHAREKEENER